MVAANARQTHACPRCNAGASCLYVLPEKVLKSKAAPRSACYFCYVRVVGIKPTRRLVVPGPSSGA
jgi:hypothetical protein